MVSEYSEIFLSRFGGPILAKRLVSGLSEPDKQRLSTIMRNRHYNQGQTIFARDIVPAEVLIVTYGHGRTSLRQRYPNRLAWRGPRSYRDARRSKILRHADGRHGLRDKRDQPRYDLIWYLAKHARGVLSIARGRCGKPSSRPRPGHGRTLDTCDRRHKIR